MSEMIERVAKVIAEEINGGKFDDNRWYNDDQREVHMRRAKVAIEAMREPTEKMYKAASYILTAQSGVYGPDDIWASMIDEALK
jgi:hypothetical protein